MHSSRLHEGLDGRGMNSSTKGEEIVEGGVVVIVRYQTVGFWCEGVVFLRTFIVLIAEGCFLWNSYINDSALMWVSGSQLLWASEKPFHLIRYCS